MYLLTLKNGKEYKNILKWRYARDTFITFKRKNGKLVHVDINEILSLEEI